MNNNQEKVSLSSIGSGAATERWALALNDVLNNIIDPNTSAVKARKITLEITIKPDENREFSDVEIGVKTALAPIMPVKTQIYVGRDAKGNGVARECQFDPRQTNIAIPKNITPLGKEIAQQ